MHPTKEKHQSAWLSTLIVVGIIGASFVVAGWSDTKTDHKSEVTELLQCNYTEDFLAHLGASSEEQCESLNVALYEQASDECEQRLGSSGSLSKEEYVGFLDQCIYHAVMTQIAIPMSYEATNYARSTGKSPYHGATASE